MAKKRKTGRKAAPKRAVKKRRATAKKKRTVAKAKPRRVKKAPQPKSFVEAVVDAAHEAGTLRGRLAGHNTFED